METPSKTLQHEVCTDDDLIEMIDESLLPRLQSAAPSAVAKRGEENSSLSTSNVLGDVVKDDGNILNTPTLPSAALSAAVKSDGKNSKTESSKTKNYQGRSKRGGKRNRVPTVTPPLQQNIQVSKKPKHIAETVTASCSETTLSQPLSYSDALKESLYVVVVNEKSQYGIITEEEGILILKEVDKALFSDLTLLEKIFFEHSGMKNSRLHFHCTNMDSVKWLGETIEKLEKKENMVFKVIPRSEIPKPIRASLMVPSYLDIDSRSVLNRVKLQNPVLQTNAWRIYNDVKHKDGGRTVFFGIEKHDLDQITALEGKLYFGLSRLQIRIHGSEQGEEMK